MDDNKQDVSVEQGIINSVQNTQADVKTFAKDNEMRLYQMAGAMSRSLLAGRLGTQFSGERDLYASFGYVLNPQYRDYRNLFDRQGLASRAVTKFADDTWNKPPIITDGDSRSDTLDEKATPFLKEWVKLSKRLRVYSVFRRADIMLGFSKYSVIFLGLPGKKYSDPAGRSKGLYYLRAFDENQAGISSWIKDNTLAEYGMPESYTVSFADEAGGMVEVEGGNLVHYSRLIHIAEDKLSSIIYGTPRLQKVINRLFDLEKTTGGGAEAAWLAVFKGILFLAREGAELPREGTQEYDQLNGVINAFMHRQQRYATVSDVDVQDLGVSEVNIKSIFEVLIADLCGSLGIPQRILLGSERGELASSQDKMEWNSLINSRRTNFAEPDILRPFIDKCVTLGVLPPPKSGDEYGIIWPDVYPMTKTEKADYALKLAQGASSVTGGNPEDALDINEFRNEVDLPPRTEKQLNDFQDERDERAQEVVNQKPNTNGKEKDDTQDRKQVANLNEKSGPFTRLIRRFFPNSFPGHKGRPGKVGGSLPRSAGDQGDDPAGGDYYSIITGVADELGFDKKKLRFFNSEGKKMEVDGREFTVLGEYSRKTGQVSIYDVRDTQKTVLRGITAHEIMHSKFHTWADDIGKEEYADEINNKFISGSKWDDLYETDGVTPYSSAYWETAYTQNGDTAYTDAIDETLSEIARVHAENDEETIKNIHPAWIEFYEEMKNVKS